MKSNTEAPLRSEPDEPTFDADGDALDGGGLRSLGVDTIWALANDGFLLIATMASFLLLSSVLNTDGFGRYSGLFGVIGPLGGAAFAGTTLAVLQRAIQKGDDAATVARSSLSLGLLAGTGTAILAVTVASLTISGLSLLEMSLIAAAELIAAATVWICAALLQTVAGLPAASKLRIAMSVIRFIVVVSLWSAGVLSIATLGGSLLVGYSILAVVALTVVLPRSGIPVSFGTPRRDFAIASASFAGPISASLVQTDGDRVVMNAFGQQDAAGEYGAAFRFVMFGLLPLKALDFAAFQRFLPHDEAATGVHLRRAIGFIKLSTVLMIPIALVLFFLAPVLPELVPGDEADFSGSTPMIRWLLLFLPLISISTAPNNGLIGLGRTGVRAFNYVSSALISLAIYIALIPSMSWRGAIIGTIVGELYLAIIGWSMLVHFQRKHDATVSDTTPAEATPAGV